MGVAYAIKKKIIYGYEKDHIILILLNYIPVL